MGSGAGYSVTFAGTFTSTFASGTYRLTASGYCVMHYEPETGEYSTTVAST